MGLMREGAWTSLLDLIRDGTVVPVLGARLLVDENGHSLQGRVASRLLADYDVSEPESGLPQFHEINEAVTLIKTASGADFSLQELYGDIDRVMRDLRKQGQLPVPESMRQLAQIADFRLFVTLTFDDMLAQALMAASRPVNEIVHSPKLPTNEGADLPLDWSRPGGPAQLLYLFGKARPTPLFAIHDEDVLEYAHNVIARGSHAPTSFLGALQDRSLLLIGCNFPDWMSRFILRATRKGRLADQRDAQQWLVEPLAREDPFIGFLGRYSPQTKVLSNVEPAAFIAELHQRWMDAHLPDGGAERAPAPPPAPDNAMFFISYSRTTDLQHAQRLYESLINLGVSEHEIWFDKTTLEPGENFRQSILDGIRGCRSFLPLVSRAATGRDEAFVFTEWDTATQRLPAVNRRGFLVPLVVDDGQLQPNAYKQSSVQSWVNRDVNFGHAPLGVPDAATLSLLKSVIRESRGAT